MNRKLHILFLCGWYPSRVFPNNGDFIHRHAKAVSLKHKVSIIHIISDENNMKNIEIVSDKIDGVHTHIAYLKKTRNPLQKGNQFLKAYKILLKKVGFFDMIHLNELFPFGVLALYSKWLSKKPFIISEHWTDYKFPLSNKISKIQKSISKIIAKNASFICPVTSDLKNSMQIFGLKGTYKIVENVVDTEVFFPIKKDAGKFTIIHISNMNDAHKNVSGILNVVQKIQEKTSTILVKIIGENAMKYVALANDLNINPEIIEFINHVPHREIIAHLQQANLFVLFSNFENLPCVILEAFACGTPVISTNVGGINEYFPNDFGVLIPPKDEQKLEIEILKFYHKKKGLASKEKMHTYINEHFSENAIADKFHNLYVKTLET
ncbi:glycosyltransferase family 4 protein [Polaribacter porphyrae]|uniref:glycosyltransferase family 4 protein n=1 Tax=Polaribacter porphyrae TaxID=1137780 RepID=UPI0014752679|nr:glycosyltransferase family 4 protein [Polaribacter porphyrae]